MNLDSRLVTSWRIHVFVSGSLFGDMDAISRYKLGSDAGSGSMALNEYESRASCMLFHQVQCNESRSPDPTL